MVVVVNLALTGTTDGYLSNSELDFDPQVNIFPNPSRGEFALDVYGFNGSTTIEVFNTLGEKVISKQVEAGAYYNEKVNLTNQSNGIYFIRISNGDNQIVKQIIKMSNNGMNQFIYKNHKQIPDILIDVLTFLSI